jgi:hypothetical protein
MRQSVCIRLCMARCALCTQQISCRYRGLRPCLFFFPLSPILEERVRVARQPRSPHDSLLGLAPGPSKMLEDRSLWLNESDYVYASSRPAANGILLLLAIGDTYAPAFSRLRGTSLSPWFTPPELWSSVLPAATSRPDSPRTRLLLMHNGSGNPERGSIRV